MVPPPRSASKCPCAERMRRAGRLRALSDHDQAGEQRQHWPGAFSWLSQVTGGSNWAGENKRHSGATCGSCRGRGWGPAALCDVVLCASSQLERHPRRWRFLYTSQAARALFCSSGGSRLRCVFCDIPSLMLRSEDGCHVSLNWTSANSLFPLMDTMHIFT